MKYVKMLGLAAVAAAALMAFVGASTASATVLCKNGTTTTTCSEKYGATTTIESKLVTGTKAKLATAFKTVECGKSAVAGKSGDAKEGEGSATETVKGAVTTLTFEECNCEVVVLKKGTLEVHSIAGTDNGTVTSNGAEVTVQCNETIFGKVHCIYVTENTDLGPLTGGNPAKLKAEASIPRLKTDSLCSEKANWTAEYEVTAPKPLFISAG